MRHSFLKGMSSLKKTKPYDIMMDAVFCFFGSLIYSASVAMFTAPNKIAPGGVTGISTVLFYLIHTPIGVMIFVLNIPLFILGLRFIGGPFMVKSIICTTMTSVFVDLMEATHFYKYTGNMLLAALYGGILSGTGLGLIFLRGGTSGGSDIGSRLLKLKFKHVSMGRMMMILDAMVIIASAIVFRNVESGLYALISIFASSRVIDSILYGSDNGKMAVIISKDPDALANAIIGELGRGLTLLKGKGYYTGQERDVIMCAVRRSEAAQLRTVIRKIDPSAFIIMCEASEVIGFGFKPITKEI